MSVSITIGVPAYSRPVELRELIQSILSCDVMPDELLICEDASPERIEIRRIVNEFRAALESKGCRLQYVENEKNLGYDGNIRELIARSSSEYLILLGNDDQLYPDAVQEVRRYVAENLDVNFISRTYRRFTRDRDQGVLNETWLSKVDRTYTPENSSPGMIFRLCGFVGGLIIKTAWAQRLATTKYDGSLYYQYYIACHAFFDGGIGYISKAIAAGRADNPPLFGNASAEVGVHVPGSYRPAGRARMWRGVLQISRDVEKDLNLQFSEAVTQELAGRQSVHIFEMMPTQGRRATLELFRELKRIGLIRSVMPWALLTFILIFGSTATVGFRMVRFTQFSVEKYFRIKW